MGIGNFCDCREYDCHVCGPHCRELDRKQRERDKEEAKPKWKMRDGTLIKIEDMEDSHLLNSMKMLQRKVLLNEDFYNLTNEVEKRNLNMPNEFPKGYEYEYEDGSWFFVGIDEDNEW